MIPRDEYLLMNLIQLGRERERFNLIFRDDVLDVYFAL
jgi:hypothetical protein